MINLCIVLRILRCSMMPETSRRSFSSTRNYMMFFFLRSELKLPISNDRMYFFSNFFSIFFFIHSFHTEILCSDDTEATWIASRIEISTSWSVHSACRVRSLSILTLYSYFCFVVLVLFWYLGFKLFLLFLYFIFFSCHSNIEAKSTTKVEIEKL